ncbi:MAG: MauE/DoxX family redox-associated membrane protein [Chitinophagaceae bacterium]
MKKTAIVEVISALFILLFIYAAFSKLFDYGQFAMQLRQSPMLAAFAGWVAWLVPASEIIISIMLLIPQVRLKALYASFTLMLIFSAYIFILTRFSDHVPCSCGGILEKFNWNQHLLFNIFFVALGIIGVLIHPGQSIRHAERTPLIAHSS